MNFLTERAVRVVLKMSLQEREAILNIFNEYIGPSDPLWVSNPCWPIPATELYMALMADRGY